MLKCRHRPMQNRGNKEHCRHDSDCSQRRHLTCSGGELCQHDGLCSFDTAAYTFPIPKCIGVCHLPFSAHHQLAARLLQDATQQIPYAVGPLILHLFRAPREATTTVTSKHQLNISQDRLSSNELMQTSDALNNDTDVLFGRYRKLA